MNQHQTHRLASRISASIEKPLTAILNTMSANKNTQLDPLKLIKLRVHLESALHLISEQVGVRSLGGLLLHQTQAKEFQVINTNLVNAVSEAGLVTSGNQGYANNSGECSG